MRIWAAELAQSSSVPIDRRARPECGLVGVDLRAYGGYEKRRRERKVSAGERRRWDFSWTPTSVTSRIAECAPRRAGRDPPGLGIVDGTLTLLHCADRLRGLPAQRQNVAWRAQAAMTPRLSPATVTTHISISGSTAVSALHRAPPAPVYAIGPPILSSLSVGQGQTDRLRDGLPER